MVRRLAFPMLLAASACSGSGSSTISAPVDAAPTTPPPESDAAPVGVDAAEDASPPPGADGGAIVTGTVTVHRGTTAGTIGAGFVGLSYEKAHLRDGFFAPTNASLVALLQRLGPGVLRVGGNTVDRTEWGTFDGGAPAPDAGAPEIITPADVDGLAGLAKAAGWTVIYGLDMKASYPSVAADEAAYAANALGSSLSGFEIGNEVDLYKATLLSSTWSYSTFTPEWQQFAAAVRARAGAGVPLTGPASASHYATWTVPFAADEAGAIDLLTQHYYRANGQLPSSTIDLLLQPDPALVTMLDALAKAAKGAKLAGGYRVAECNSFYNGGAAGVSDAYGTALWAIDFLFANAEHGSAGVNFHGGGNGPGYTPIADASGAVVGVRPIFYGMLLFALAGRGPVWATTADAAGVSFSAYAVGGENGKTSVVLVNKDRTSTVRAAVDVGANVASAAAMTLRGPTLEATTGVTLGGAAIDPSGAFSPAPDAPLPIAGSVVTVDVPPASAVLVHAE